jgi:trehalose 6-phosphate synthase
MLPDDVGRALIDGILGADRAGFHAERWATAFMGLLRHRARRGRDPDRAGRSRARARSGG